MIQGDSKEIAFLHQPKSIDFIKLLKFTCLNKSIVKGEKDETKYIGYFILFSIMLVLTLVFSTNSYRAMSPGSNVRGGITNPPEINRR